MNLKTLELNPKAEMEHIFLISIMCENMGQMLIVEGIKK